MIPITVGTVELSGCGFVCWQPHLHKNRQSVGVGGILTRVEKLSRRYDSAPLPPPDLQMSRVVERFVIKLKCISSHIQLFIIYTVLKIDPKITSHSNFINNITMSCTFCDCSWIKKCSQYYRYFVHWTGLPLSNCSTA